MPSGQVYTKPTEGENSLFDLNALTQLESPRAEYLPEVQVPAVAVVPSHSSPAGQGMQPTWPTLRSVPVQVSEGAVTGSGQT